MIAGLGAAAAGVAGVALLPDRVDAAVVPKRARPALRNTSVIAPPITAERSQRIATADFRPPDNATAFQVANGVNEMQEPNGGTLVATFRPAAGDVMTSVEINIDPDGQPGSFTLAREEATGTVTPLVTARPSRRPPVSRPSRPTSRSGPSPKPIRTPPRTCSR